MSEIIKILGGEVEVQRAQYSVTYTVDLMAHPYLTRLPLDTRLLILHKHPRRRGTTVTCGGCSEWTPERFLEMVASEMELGNAFAACLSEPNYISAAFGIKDHKTAAERIAASRAKRIAAIRRTLAAEGIDLHEEAVRCECGEPADTSLRADPPICWKCAEQADRTCRD